MKKIFSIFILSILLSISINLSAQPPNPGGGQGDPPGVPIDGGLSLLLAAGVAYGGKKMYDINKEKEDSM